MLNGLLFIDRFLKHLKTKIMKKILLFALLFIFGSISEVYSQATLPLSRTTWNAGNPTGWTSSGTGSYTSSFACTGNNMGRLDSDNDYYEVHFTVADGDAILVEYTLKGAGFSGGDFDVEYSHDGSTWVNLSSFGTLSGSCADEDDTYTASGTDSYVRFYYTDKVSGNVGLDDVAISLNTTTTPITLASFTAKPMDNENVSLDWATASEENNEYFSIEHSTDGRDFVEVGMIEGALNSTTIQTYNFMHKEAKKGMNYYRLRQVDTDGTFSFSPVEVVSLSSDVAVEVRPTLADESVVVVVNETFNTEMTIEVYNILGRVISTEVLARGATQMTMDVQDLQKGHYLIRISNGQESFTKRFIKR